MKGQKALFSSATVEWSTPDGVYKALDDEFHFNFDPCPLGGDKDGTSSLFTSWRERAFCKPCGLNWGIEENCVQWDYGFPNLHKVPCGATSNSEVLSQEPENENRSGLLVSDLCKKTSARNNSHLSSMQLSQKEQKPLPFLSRPGPSCKNCGLPTSVQPVRAFINCPYDRIGKWLLRAKDAPLTVYLIPARTDVKWFHEIVLPYASEIRFIKGRLKFGGSKNSEPFPSMIVIFKK